MTPFEVMIEDIFCNRDMTEEMIFNGKRVRVAVSALDFAPSVTDFGAEQGVNFYLGVKVGDAVGIKRGSLIEYRGVTYKVERTEIDSAGLTMNVYLVGVTRY